jgi:hypothetical protein
LQESITGNIEFSDQKNNGRVSNVALLGRYVSFDERRFKPVQMYGHICFPQNPGVNTGPYILG